jgi:hypothetical protein
VGILVGGIDGKQITRCLKAETIVDYIKNNL